MRYATILILTAALALASCQNKTQDQPADGAKSEQTSTPKKKKNIIRQRLSIPSDFNYITNLGSVDIIYTPGNFSIEAEGDSATLSYLRTTFDSNLLTVCIQSDANADLNKYGNTSNVKLYISCPQLACVSVCGNGGFESQATWRGEDIQIGVLGSGSLKLADVECTTFSLQSNDVGSVSIAHLKADDAVLMSVSSAHIEADVDVNNLTVFNEGQQTMKLTGKAQNTIVKNRKDPNLQLDVKSPLH